MSGRVRRQRGERTVTPDGQAVGREVPPLPRLRDPDSDPTSRVDPRVLLPRLLATSERRLEWLELLLQQQLTAQGMAGLVGYTQAVTPDGQVHDLDERTRALVELEQRERDRAAELAEKIARLGLDAGRMHHDVARWVSASVQALVAELGLTMHDPVVLRAAQRSVMVARRQAGFDVGDVDATIGTRVTAAERVALLEGVLEQAHRDVAAVAAATGDVPDGR